MPSGTEGGRKQPTDRPAARQSAAHRTAPSGEDARTETTAASGRTASRPAAVRRACSSATAAGPRGTLRLTPDQASAAAAAGVSGGAKRVCLVASGRGPTDRDVDRVSDTIKAIKEQNESVEVCACLGLLSDGQAERLREAGADAYNHNLNTSESTYGDITTTHTYADRVDTVNKAHAAGLSACSGLIAGMGESDEDLVDVVFSLRELDPDSVPVNFLIPMEGTPLATEWHLTPQRCLRILAMTRFVCPDVEVRIAGGREVHLRTMQPLALHLANSIFLGDYLTSEGQAGHADLEMIAERRALRGGGRRGGHPAGAPRGRPGRRLRAPARWDGARAAARTRPTASCRGST
ncbi:Biotin synthase [Streptomyces violaceorubidus]